MATTESINLAQQMYVAYYGRPADQEGLDFWAEAFDASDDLDAALAAFGASAEFTSAFGALTNTQLVTNLYQQLFSHAPDAEGLAFYVARLDAETSTLAQIATQIADGASGTDITALANKIVVASTYTAAVTADGAPYTAAEIAGAQAVLAAVDDTAASVTAGNTAAEAEVAANATAVGTEAAAAAAYADLLVQADATATAGEKASSTASRLLAAEEAIAAGSTQAEIDAAYDVLVAAGSAGLALSSIIALDAANTAVVDYLAATDSAYDTNENGAVTAAEVTAELSAAAVAYNAVSPVSDLATDGSDTAAEIAAIHTLQEASLAATLTTNSALLDVEQVAVDAITGLEAAITAADTAAEAFEDAYDADEATGATLAAATAAYDVNNGTAVINADGTVSDTAMVSIGTIVDGDGGGTFGTFTLTFSALAVGQSITVEGTTVTAATAMTDAEVADAFEAALTLTGYTGDATGANATVVYTWGVDEVKDVSADTTDAIALAVGGTEATNEGLAALKAAALADVAAIAALSDANDALSAAVQATIRTELDSTTATAGTGAIDTTGGTVTLDYTDTTGGGTAAAAPIADGYIAAQAPVAATQALIATLGTTKLAFDAINAVDDGLTPLEATLAAAGANVDELDLSADQTFGTDTVGLISSMVAGDAETVTDFNAATDFIFVGSDYTLNTGALTTGDNAVLEMFITDKSSTDDTAVLTFETAVFGSASEGDFFTIELTGITVADITVDNGLVLGA